ncbi:MAG: hypothetical protein HRT82_11255 [Henriciella sp.]|nr:hypothetical protein [Henriciella sp.]
MNPTLSKQASIVSRSREKSHRLIEVLKRAAVVRGFFGMLLIFEVATRFADLSNYELARFLSSVLVAWNVIAAKIGEVIGILPFIPPLSSDLVNWVVFMTSVTIPGIFGAYVYADPKEYRTDEAPEFFSILIRSRAMFFLLSILFVLGPIIFYGAMEFSPESWETSILAPGSVSSNWENPLLGVYALSMLLPFGLAVLFLKQYRVGVLILIGAMAAGTLFYFSPIIGDEVRNVVIYLEQMQLDPHGPAT